MEYNVFANSWFFFSFTLNGSLEAFLCSVRIQPIPDPAPGRVQNLKIFVAVFKARVRVGLLTDLPESMFLRSGEQVAFAILCPTRSVVG
jgi:hypothetical protein